MKMNLQDYVAIYRINDLSICENIIKNIDDQYWEKHAYNNVTTGTNNTYPDDLDISYQSDSVDNFILDFVQESLKDYVLNVSHVPFSLQEVSKFRYNKYEVGTNMKIHHDHIHTCFDGTKKGIPILTVVGLLNDNFRGGNFLMFDDQKVNLSAGDIIIFPSNFLYPHSVTTVIEGTRYSFVAWAW